MGRRRWPVAHGQCLYEKTGANKVIKVANIIEEGRLGGPQIRIAEVAGALSSRQYGIRSEQKSETNNQKSDVSNEEINFKVGNGEDDKALTDAVDVETTVIFPKYESEDFRKRLDEYNIPYIQLPLHRLSKGLPHLIRYVLWFPFEIFILLRVLKKKRFDVVHVSGGSWQIKGVIAGKLAGCRALWHLNDTRIHVVKRAFLSLIAGWAADGFIVAGERVRECYGNLLDREKSKPIFEIQAPVNCTYFDPQVVNPDEKIAVVDAIKIVSVGSINYFKGFEHFLNMAELLNQKYGNLHFFIIGPHWNSQQAYSKKLHQSKVDKNLQNLTFYGPSSDVRKVHKAADIYVCSSIAEASPLSVWEAMAMQKPIVATDVGDIGRFITHRENGYIVSPADPEALAYYVGKLVQDPELREKFGKKARNTALKELDISNVAQKHVDSYRCIITTQSADVRDL